MDATLMIEQDRQIAEVVAEQRSRLRNFIRRRVPNESDVEELLQDVFYELVKANRLLMPVEYVTGWLFSVARNCITDLFRKKKPESFSDSATEGEEGELLRFEDLLPSPDAGPEALYLRKVLLHELERPWRIACRAKGGLCGARIGRPQLQGDVRRKRRKRQYPALAQALRGAIFAPTVAEHSRRI